MRQSSSFYCCCLFVWASLLEPSIGLLHLSRLYCRPVSQLSSSYLTLESSAPSPSLELMFLGPMTSVFSCVLEAHTFQLLPEESVDNLLVWKISYIFLHTWLLVRLDIEISPQRVFTSEFPCYPVASSVAVQKCCATLVPVSLYVICSFPRKVLGNVLYPWYFEMSS